MDEEGVVRIAIIFFFAERIALSIADAVSGPLPVPTPTEPRRFPRIIATLKLKRLPPEDTRATRLILMSFWSNSERALCGRPPLRTFFLRIGKRPPPPPPSPPLPREKPWVLGTLTAGDLGTSVFTSCFSFVSTT